MNESVNEFFSFSTHFRALTKAGCKDTKKLHVPNSIYVHKNKGASAAVARNKTALTADGSM